MVISLEIIHLHLIFRYPNQSIIPSKLKVPGQHPQKSIKQLQFFRCFQFSQFYFFKLQIEFLIINSNFHMKKKQSRASSMFSHLSQKSNTQENQMFNSYKVEQIDELRQIFKMYDRDNIGNITSRTLKFLLRGLGDNVNEEQVDMILKDMDEDGNGTIDFQQFLLYMLQKVNSQNLYDDLIEIFQVFDRDDTGYITKNELEIILEDQKYYELITSFVEMGDIEGEGQINYKNYFSRILKS